MRIYIYTHVYIYTNQSVFGELLHPGCVARREADCSIVRPASPEGVRVQRTKGCAPASVLAPDDGTTEV